MNGEMVWIVGKVNETGGHDGVWEFQGVFHCQDDAIQACRTDHYFIGPAMVGARLADELFEWPGSYFPHEVD